jgi:penicillin amidase
MRFVADLSNWENSQLVITTGQSGHILTGHYKDQWSAYLSGRGLPLEFNKVNGKAPLILQPR